MRAFSADAACAAGPLCKFFRHLGRAGATSTALPPEGRANDRLRLPGSPIGAALGSVSLRLASLPIVANGPVTALRAARPLGLATANNPDANVIPGMRTLIGAHPSSRLPGSYSTGGGPPRR